MRHRWVSIVPGGGDTGGLSAIRSLRVLRPLRTMSSFPGLRVIVQTILASLPMCGVVLLLAMYLFSIFAIFGVQSFAGELKRRCAVSHKTHHEEARLRDLWLKPKSKRKIRLRAVARAHSDVSARCLKRLAC